MNRRILFLAGLLFQLVAVFGLFLPYVLLASRGTQISLRTVPIDPRSLFRGDYVMLGYEVGQGIPSRADGEEYGETLYVVLEKKGEFQERIATSETRPELAPGQVCLAGVHQWNGLHFPDIGQYFVEEGLGRELEDARNAHRLIVDAAVNDVCDAVILDVRLGPEIPQSELPEWMAPGEPPAERPVPPPPPPPQTGSPR